MEEVKKMAKIYHLFISHSWAYGDAYDKLTNMLDGSIDYSDYSVPKDDPIHDADNDKELEAAIKEQMKHASVVLIMAGKYSTYSKWIKKEIKIAKEGFNTPKPIIAITPWGAEQISSVVKNAADKVVKWNTSSIVAAIKELG